MSKQDPRYLKLQPIFNHPAKVKIIIWGRASGKSYSTKYRMLETIEKEGKEFIWLRRQFDSIRTGSLESWKRVIASYHQENKGDSKKDWELVWDAITRGIKYKGTMKCFMIELFSSYKARENYTQTISEIIFDESIINPKTGEEYLEDEEGKIKELIGSAWRDREQPAPKLTYIANPYERFRPFMANFLPLIRKDLSKLKQRIFANEIVNLEQKGELLSLYKPSKCLKESECSCIDENCVENWNNFFAKEEDLKITEFINGSAPLYLFNGCILYQAKKGFCFFVKRENKEISKKEEIKFIPEWYVDNQQRRDSRQINKVPVEESYLKEDLLWKWENNQLRFCADGSREIIMEFMGKGKFKHSTT